MDHEGRIRRLQGLLPEASIDGILITNLTNVRYLTGFSGTNGQVLVTADDAIFFTDPRYRARAGDLVRGAEVVVYPARLTDALGDHLARLGVARVGVESATMTLAERDDLAERLGNGIGLEPTKNLVEDLRRIKEPAELEALRAAVALGDAAFTWALQTIAPGITERDFALQLEIRMREAGAEAVSFEPIVGSGPLSAHIHHTPSDRTLEKGDLVLLDFGCKLDGYCSDLTRTVSLGPSSDDARSRYDVVLAAQVAGIAAVRAGADGREVDATARAVVDAAGHKDDFGHGLGHGVGLDIHEAPRLHPISEDVLQVGDVVTVEPGVYVVGDGGIRIEDVVAVTAEGCDVLGTAPKDTLLEV